MTSDGSRTADTASSDRSTHRIDGHSITLQRVINAPRELVFAAWTDPVQVAKWWGPHGFNSEVRQMDVAVGRMFRICMVAPDGIEYPIKGAYQEIVAPERLVYVDDWDDDGKPSQQSRVIVSFAEHGAGKTLLTLEMRFGTIAQRVDAEAQQIIPGWGECFERLDALVSAR
ncbi:SRPBCC domain-containing protein [Lysobacter sp. CA196]|uniref:SRPBCC domain-containing protein n=1 Tax=Lysobacter sp. CA196 TaxID=3455606 RepID=UPI003F8CF5E6